MIFHMSLRALICLCILSLCLAFQDFGAKANVASDFELLIDADAPLPQIPDSLDNKAHTPLERDWKYLLKSRQGLSVYDESVRWPRFVEGCLKIYRWADRVFNQYDTLYVVSYKRKGKVKIFNNNWVDIYYFHPKHELSLKMMSRLYPNVGINGSYGIFSLSYSIDLRTVFQGTKPHYHKLDFGFNCARLMMEFHYWRNDGGTYIRQFGDMGAGKPIKEWFSGLQFAAVNLGATYFFNNRRFCYGAAYDMSRIQRRSAGTWLAGITASMYDADFDLNKLSQEMKDYFDYKRKQYNLDYWVLDATFGYSYNWVCNKHFLFNITAIPGLGISHTSSKDEGRHRTLFNGAFKALTALNYQTGRFFLSLTANASANVYNSSELGFSPAVAGFTMSAGMRF